MEPKLVRGDTPSSSFSSGSKTRLDQYLVTTGVFETRAQAAAAIKAGGVMVNGTPARKAAQSIFATDDVTAKPAHGYVSRGGLKLEKGLAHFAYPIADKIAVDIGASTGGFSDVLLKNGARHVYAVDVGRDQLHEKLAGDARVSNMQGMNARHLTADAFATKPEVLVCDASFISLKLVLEAVLRLMADDAVLLALIKPQFEVGKANLGKNGVVSDENLRAEICSQISDWVSAHPSGWRVDGLVESPITGPQGNVEYIIGATRNP